MALLGIDAGSTVTKVALFDNSGRELAVASRRVETIQPKPGLVERNMDVVWQQTADAIREIINISGVAADEIAGIGCTGHGNGAYLLDVSGQPLGNVIHAMDMRGAEILSRWKLEGVLQEARNYTLQDAYAGQTATVLSWLKTHDPRRYENIAHVLLCKDFINYRLTGEITTDYSDIGCTNLLDVNTGTYSEELLQIFDLIDMASKLPQPCHSSNVIGQVTAEAAVTTGLKPGTPVVAGMIDLAANAVGTGTVQVGQACIIAGTWGINQVLTENPLTDPDLFLNTFSADASRYLVVEGSATSTANLEWFIKQCCQKEQELANQQDKSIYDLCNELVADVDIAASKVIFHPFLYASNVDGLATAGFYGLTAWDTQATMLHAIYEGVVFAHLTHIEKLRRAGADFNVARFTGGAARSEVWSQMFADVLQVPLEVTSREETGTLGAALVAGAGSGIFSNIEEAAGHCVEVNKTYQPDPERTEIYMRRYAVYQQLTELMCQGQALLEQL